ncbi:hypothetical protein [Methylobacterium sp. V23]|uniref:hypothetical protein n=1 Tax=Methylobacterium sp. V23 TaxID=2044878 RepID=UPI000CDA83D7|nr:hypothetical protein [Methylobacterium sp. V23]POR41089.1 hypothetical protein CRT23_20210 [Methylobacterium sp. V23]
MDHLSQTVRDVIALAVAYRPGAIIEAEQVVDTYLMTFRGYRSRAAAIECLRAELALPAHRTLNRGGLFEQIERHLGKRHREAARLFQ